VLVVATGFVFAGMVGESGNSKTLEITTSVNAVNNFGFSTNKITSVTDTISDAASSYSVGDFGTKYAYYRTNEKGTFYYTLTSSPFVADDTDVTTKIGYALSVDGTPVTVGEGDTSKVLIAKTTVTNGGTAQQIKSYSLGSVALTQADVDVAVSGGYTATLTVTVSST